MEELINKTNKIQDEHSPGSQHVQTNHRLPQGESYRFCQRTSPILEIERGRYLADGRLFSPYLNRDAAYTIPDNIKGFIFDFDGTLVPLNWSESIRQRAIITVIQSLIDPKSRQPDASNTMDTISEIYRAVFGKPEQEMCRIVSDRLQQDSTDSIIQAFLDYTDRFKEQMVTPSPIRRNLNRLIDQADSRGIQLAAVSNSDMIAPRTLEKSMPKIDLTKSTFALQDPNLRIKPHPDMLLESCKKMQLEPSEVLVFEDSPTGAIAALRAGTKVLLQPSEAPFVTCQKITHTIQASDPDLFERSQGSVILLANKAKWSQPRFA